MLIGGIIISIVLLALGPPIWVCFSIGSTLGILYFLGLPMESVAQYFQASIDRYALLALIFFLMAGNIMGEGGISKSIVDAANAVIGHIRGGMGLVLTSACAIFAAMSGSNIATAVSIGTVMIPRMTELGYPKRFSAAVTCMSGCLGVLIPPSVSAIIYGMVTQKSVGKLMMAGLLPGILLTFLFFIPTIIISRRNHYQGSVVLSSGERFKSIIKAFPASLIIIVVLGGMYTGVFTPTEAAAVSCLACAIVGVVFYRDLTWSRAWKAALNATRSSANIWLIVGAASLLGMLVTVAQIPQKFTELILNFNMTPITFSLLAVVVFLVLGMALEVIVMVLVAMPIFMPVMDALGIDYYMFYVLVAIVTGIGQNSPPEAIILYVVSDIVKENPMAVFKTMLPWMAMMVLLCLILIFFPAIATWIPSKM